MSDDNDIAQLLQQLQALRLRETQLIERIQVLTSASEDSPCLIHIGARVRFKSTRVTRAGTGTVLGYTNGTDPFLRIQRDDNLSEIKRKPTSVALLRPASS